MTVLLILALIVSTVLLWSELSQMRQRVELLERTVDWLEQRGVTPQEAPNRSRVRAAIVKRAVAQQQTPIETIDAPSVAPAPEPVPEAVVPPPVIEPEPQPEIQPEPQPESEPQPEPAAPDRPSFGFEEMFGRRLPIWAGGATLAVAGVFIVKYSIDAGLLSPAIRVILGLLFGFGLIGGAEAALRAEARVGDPRIRQALAGAGVATLYASILVAANLYGLIGGGLAFAGLALTTLLAGLLSIRFGPASAVLGLVGGLAAPALVGAGPPDMSLLAAYLALAVGGLCALGRTQRWWWLGAAALAGGFGWGFTLILTGALDTAAALSLGSYTLLIAVAFPLMLTGGPSQALRWAGTLAGCAQMAAIVATGGFAPLTWALYGLLSAAAVWLSRRDPQLADVPLPALAVALMLAIAWPDPTATGLAAVLAGMVAIFAAPALLRLWRPDGRIGDAVQIAGVAAGVALLPLHLVDGLRAGSFALLGAAMAAGAASLGWRAERSDARFAILVGTAAALLSIAAGLALPEWQIAPAVALLAGALLLLGDGAGDTRIVRLASAFGGLALLLLPLVEGWSEIGRALGNAPPVDIGAAMLRWGVAALVAALFARRATGTVGIAGQVAAVLLGTVAIVQPVPPTLMALAPAALLAGIGFLRPQARAALATAAGVTLGWAALPAAKWAFIGLGALAGFPAYASNLPGWHDALLRLAIPSAAFAFALLRAGTRLRLRWTGLALAAALAIAALHILWKQLFHLADHGDFVARGMAERTLWEALLAALAVTCWRLGSRPAALAAGAAALAHFGWFTLLVHNPLWADQAVGPWLVPAYGLAAALLWAAGKVTHGERVARLRDGGLMILVLVFGVSALRQMFHGPLLSSPGLTDAEDIARSVFAILAAVGFLAIGIRTASRDWRLASLGLMLLTVGKVFVFDVAGLDGLARIGSFVALGFSLLGVGWLYSRYLPARTEG